VRNQGTEYPPETARSRKKKDVSAYMKDLPKKQTAVRRIRSEANSCAKNGGGRAGKKEKGAGGFLQKKKHSSDFADSPASAEAGQKSSEVTGEKENQHRGGKKEGEDAIHDQKEGGPAAINWREKT